MKPRTVIVTLELETNYPLKELKGYVRDMVSEPGGRNPIEVRQVTVTVAQAPKETK